MDDLYVEKWPISFNVSGGQKKFPVLFVWRFNQDTNQITRIAQWPSFPWGGNWEDISKSIKPARMIEGKLHKIAQKHTHVLAPVKTTKILSNEQKEELDFLVKYPERGFHNYRQWKQVR
jgi:hypothetical protein